MGVYITHCFYARQNPSQTAAEQGKAKQRILNFKITFSEFKKLCQTTAMRGAILKNHHLPRVGPKQFCALAHLGCTREAGTS